MRLQLGDFDWDVAIMHVGQRAELAALEDAQRRQEAGQAAAQLAGREARW